MCMRVLQSTRGGRMEFGSSFHLGGPREPTQAVRTEYLYPLTHLGGVLVDCYGILQ